MFPSTKGYAGDSGGTLVTYIVHMCTHVCTCKGFPIFTNRTVLLFLIFAYRQEKERLPKIGGMKLFGDHMACSIFTRTVSTLKASFDTTLESLQIFSALTWEMDFLSDWFSICF